MADLSQQEWVEQMGRDSDAVIIDVRTPEEVEEGRIPGAVVMNIQDTADFYQKAQTLDTSKSYYVYCRSGGRSGQACVLFKALGINHAYNLVGGILTWKGELIK